MAKDHVLFINAIRPATYQALEDYAAESGRILRPIVLVDSKVRERIAIKNGQSDRPEHVIELVADFDNPASVRGVISPYMDRLVAVLTQYENSIAGFKKLVPYLPYLSVPTEASLDWATEKKLMRQLFSAYIPRLAPKFISFDTYEPDLSDVVEQHMDYPVVVKPSGMGSSKLVSFVPNRQILNQTLKLIFEQIDEGYKKSVRSQQPSVLVEEFMAGDMYSIDTYVSMDGKFYHTPPVKVITGRQVGFDDFFGYVRLSPSGLSSDEIASAEQAAEAACRAVGLRAITAHVELMRTADGWKIIELGPRIGGFRHDIYNLTYGINHIANDILIRTGEEPIIPRDPRQCVAVFNLYARQEGTLQRISGLEQLMRLPSYVSHKQALEVGSELRFAKNNGDPIIELVLSNSDSSQLERDMAYVDQQLTFEVTVV